MPYASTISKTFDHKSQNGIKNGDSGHHEPFLASLAEDARAALALASSFNSTSARKFTNYVENCEGTLLTSGIGKSGILAERMSSSLSSVGAPSHFVHGAEWVHGDLGKAREGDICIFLSHSGNTRECVFAAEHLRDKGVYILGITSNPTSKLALCSDACITYELDFELKEPIGGVPTTSIVLQEMIINAVVSHVIQTKGCSDVQFARNHPGGSLGSKLCPTPKKD